MQSLVLALCLGWLSLSLAFPVGPVDSTSESALQSEPDLGLSTLPDELPRSLPGQNVLQSERINAKEQASAGVSTDLKMLRRRSEMSPEEKAEVIDGLAKELQVGGVQEATATCVAKKLYEYVVANGGKQPGQLMFLAWESQCRFELSADIGWAVPEHNPNARPDPQLSPEQEEKQRGNQKFQLNLNPDLGAIPSRAWSGIRRAGKAGFDAITGSRAPDPRDPDVVKRPPGRGVGGELRGPYRPPSQFRPI